MSTSGKSKTDWVAFEIASAGNAATATDGNHDREVHIARSVLNDVRKAEALCLIQPTDFLQELRTLIARGLLSEAWVKLHSYRADQTELETDPEWNLELARLFAYANEWQRCFETCELLFELQPAPMSLMTTLQIRAVAAFEIGNFHQALADINRIRSLDRIYPNTQVAYYAELVDVKVAAMLGQHQQVQTKLNQIWLKQSAAPISTFDHLLTLLRVEAFVAMAFGADPTRALELAAWTAEKQGDDLHSVLSKFELAVTNTQYPSQDFDLAGAKILFQRIAKLDRELNEGAHSTTGKVLAQAKGNSSVQPRSLTEVKLVLLPNRNLVLKLDIENLRVDIVSLKKRTQVVDALCFVARSASGVTKAELFQALFGNQKYVSHLHDPALYQVISRMRKMWSVQLNFDQGVLSAPEAVVIGGVE
jgi:hypothetical protein